MPREVTLSEASSIRGHAIVIPTYLPEGVPIEPRITVSTPPGEPEDVVTILFGKPRESLDPGDVHQVTILDVPGELSLTKYGPRIAVCGGIEVQVKAFDPYDGLSTVMSAWTKDGADHGVSVSWLSPGPEKEEMANTVMRIVNSIINSPS